jgi:hypothetical protein
LPNLTIFKPYGFEVSKPIISLILRSIGSYPNPEEVLTVYIPVFYDSGDSLRGEDILHILGFDLGGKGAGLNPIILITLRGLSRNLEGFRSSNH